jgi:hypothetical protein
MEEAEVRCAAYLTSPHCGEERFVAAGGRRSPFSGLGFCSMNHVGSAPNCGARFEERSLALEDGTDQVTFELARAGVSALASDELPFFDAMCREYERDPEHALTPKQRDDPLGFGVGEVAVLITPIALRVAREVLESLATPAAEASKRGLARLGDSVRRLIRRLRGKAAKPTRPRPAQLTEAQLARVRRVAQSSAEASGLPSDRASLLANAVVGRLVLSAP